MKFSLREFYKINLLPDAERRRSKLDAIQKMFDTHSVKPAASRDQANQHTLPEFYLKGFAATKDLFAWVIRRDRKPSKKSISKLTAEEFFYSLETYPGTRDNFFEDLFNKVETPAKEVIATKLTQRIGPSEEDRFILISFLSSLVTRTKCFRRETLPDDKGLQSYHAKLKSIEECSKVQSMLYKHWYRCDCEVVFTTDDAPFVTSDAAYAILKFEDPTEQRFYIPISCKMLIVFSDKEGCLPASDHITFRDASPGEVDSMNCAIALHCDEYAISSIRVTFEELIKPLETMP